MRTLSITCCRKPGRRAGFLLLVLLMGGAFALAVPGTASASYKAVDLNALFGASSSSAAAVNDSGEIVGRTDNWAFSYTSAGGIVNLGTLGGSYSAATGVNGKGEIVGWSDTASGYVGQHIHAFSYTPDGGMQDLGTLAPNQPLVC